MLRTRIVRKISIETYHSLIHRYESKIKCGTDALFRLNEGQRKLFKCKDIINTLTKESPRSVGIQANGRYAAFFRRKEGFIRIIFEINTMFNRLEIVTFTWEDNIPRI